jgi:hypothetical protein
VSERVNTNPNTPTTARPRVGAWAWLACAILATPALTAPGERDLTDLSRRLNEGDRAAIDELIARTHPVAGDLAASNARLERLRAEIETLRSRRAARPTFPLSRGSELDPLAPEAGIEEASATRVDGLREAIAWLRAGEPDLALKAVPNDGDEAHYVEARALEGLGRRAEALEVYRRVAQNATSPTLRARAAGDVTHLEWRERLDTAREGRP